MPVQAGDSMNLGGHRQLDLGTFVLDALGGALKAIEHGYIQREIQDSAYRWQRAVDRGEKVVVGVNQFQAEENLVLEVLRVDPAIGERQSARLKALRERRDCEKVSNALSRLADAARSDDNLVPVILHAVEEYATLGEICGVLRRVFGEYEASTVF